MKAQLSIGCFCRVTAQVQRRLTRALEEVTICERNGAAAWLPAQQVTAALDGGEAFLRRSVFCRLQKEKKNKPKFSKLSNDLIRVCTWLKSHL